MEEVGSGEVVAQKEEKMYVTHIYTHTQTPLCLRSGWQRRRDVYSYITRDIINSNHRIEFVQEEREKKLSDIYIMVHFRKQKREYFSLTCSVPQWCKIFLFGT